MDINHLAMIFIGLFLINFAFAVDVYTPINPNTYYIDPNDTQFNDLNRYIDSSGQVNTPNYYAPEDTTTASPVDWLQLMNFPDSCPAGEVVQSLGTFLTCVSISSSVTDSRIGNLVLNKWCDFNGEVINCDQSTPSGGGSYSDSNALTLINSLGLISIIQADVNYYPKSNPNGFITISQADNNYQSKGNYITIQQSDFNYQPKGSYLTSLSGHNVSELSNDLNFQSFNAVNSLFQIKGNYLTSISGNISQLTNDSNYQTFLNTENNYQHKGSYLTTLTGQNVSQLTNDSNYQNYGNLANYLKPGNNVSLLNNDSNYQTLNNISNRDIPYKGASLDSNLGVHELRVSYGLIGDTNRLISLTSTVYSKNTIQDINFNDNLKPAGYNIFSGGGWSPPIYENGYMDGNTNSNNGGLQKDVNKNLMSFSMSAKLSGATSGNTFVAVGSGGDFSGSYAHDWCPKGEGYKLQIEPTGRCGFVHYKFSTLKDDLLISTSCNVNTAYVLRIDRDASGNVTLYKDGVSQGSILDNNTTALNTISLLVNNGNQARIDDFNFIDNNSSSINYYDQNNSLKVDGNLFVTDSIFAKHYITLSKVPNIKGDSGTTALDKLNNMPTWINFNGLINYDAHYAKVPGMNALDLETRVSELEKMVYELSQIRVYQANFILDQNALITIQKTKIDLLNLDLNLMTFDVCKLDKTSASCTIIKANNKPDKNSL